MAQVYRIFTLGDLKVRVKDITQFIVRAKKACYASNKLEEILPDGSKQLTFQEGDFHYTDNYAGYLHAQGTEIVRWQKPDGQRIWQMSYSGGMKHPLEEENEKIAHITFEFLKKCLGQVDVFAPFRGPEDRAVRQVIKSGEYKGRELRYTTKTEGVLKDFFGAEEITIVSKGSEKVLRVLFEQHYSGGLVVPRRK